MKRITRAVPSPAVMVAVLALVAALAGTAVAGDPAASPSLSKKKTKRIAKKIVDRRIDRLAPELSVNHAVTADLAGSAGTAETANRATNIYWAVVSRGGNLIRRSPGVVSSERIGSVGWYHVKFARDVPVLDCAYTATSFDFDAFDRGGWATAQPSFLNEELGVEVEIRNPQGRADGAFSLWVICPA